MGNSSLVKYTKLSPNNSGKRTHAIDRITPHCVVGQLSVETLGSLFAKSSYQASCNYAIGSDGRVALIVDEGQRSWCSSSNSNDQRAVTIECASDKTSPYAFNTTVYNQLIELCVDICRRNGKTKLLWISDKDKALAYEPKSGEMLLTVHRWFANKSCPGDWLMARMGSLASAVTARLGGAASTVTVEPRDLSKGDEGEDVKKMQTMLIACGYSCGSWGADGDFGSATDSTLRKYQANRGLSVDGVYGPKSRAALEADYKNKTQKPVASAPAQATQQASAAAANVAPKYYRVRKAWSDVDSQLGAYSIYENAKACADEAGSRYAVFDWNGKEIYRASAKTEKEVRFFYPGYTRKSSPDDRQGAGCVWHDQNKNCFVFDSYFKNTEAGNNLISYLIDNNLRTLDACGSHAHSDHLGNFFKMADDDRFTIENFWCYDPASLKLAGSGSSNARSAKEDKEYLQSLIDKLKGKGTKIHYVKTGDTITCGEMIFEVNRHQPSAWSEYDTGEAWAYLNDGSICLYNRQAKMLLVGDASGEDATDNCGEIVVTEAGHHMNNGNRTTARMFVKKGVKLAIGCNNVKGGPGNCEFTRYGAGRMIEEGIEVWQLDADIKGVIKGGKMTVSQGSKSRTFDVPFGKVFYRVRKTWADASSQIGAYTILDKAKECVDQHPGYKAFDEAGKQIYPATVSATTSATTSSTPAVSVKPQTDQEKFIATVGPLAKADMAKSGILASVTLAQAILESGWGKSELALNAKNLFGMKCSLSGNTWAGSTWDGKSAYNISTGEYYSGTYATVRRDFRRYNSWAESVADHSAYLLGAMNGSKLRYNGLKGQKDYRKAAQIIKDGGYATSPTYTTNLCTLIEKYNLTLYDSGSAPSAQPAPAPAPAATTTTTSKTLAELMPVIGQGDKGKAVGVAQAILGGLELDSSFGPKTNASTIAFQKKKKLTQDGIIGKNTWTALFTAIKGGADKLPVLKCGSSGKSVTALQVMLGGLEKDGSFGPKTEARLKAVTGKTTTTYAVWKSLISNL